MFIILTARITQEIPKKIAQTLNGQIDFWENLKKDPKNYSCIIHRLREKYEATELDVTAVQ